MPSGLLLGACAPSSGDAGAGPVPGGRQQGESADFIVGTNEGADLERWAARIAEQPWERAFVFFKHEDEGAGPKMAAAFREVVGG